MGEKFHNAFGTGKWGDKGGNRPVTLPVVKFQAKAAASAPKPDPRAPRALPPHNPRPEPQSPRVVDERGGNTNYGPRPTKALTRGGEPV